MQRLFSSFPVGLPGAGLLLLRMTLGTIGAIEAGILSREDGRSFADAAAVVWCAAAVLLILGAFTPIAGVSLGAGAAALWLLGGTASLCSQSTMALFQVGSGAAVALLGPGAYSIDAKLFGRREIVVDRDRSSRTSRRS